MALKQKIHEALQATQEGQEFLAYIASGRNYMQCYANAPEMKRLLTEQGIEAIVVGAHYPDIHSGCTNFYVLCRQGGEVLLVDPTVNSEMKTSELYIATFEEAQQTIAALTSINWKTNWNFGNIVIHEPTIESGDERAAFKKEWGNFSSGLIFRNEIRNQPEKHAGIAASKGLMDERSNAVKKIPEPNSESFGDRVTKADLARRYHKARFNYF